MKNLSQFKKNKEWLVCVDSDGCAMDTMDIKHFRCFGPCMVREWGLWQWQDDILTRWNEINLYTMTRGVNRFKGLAAALEEINARYCRIEGTDALSYWAETGNELSNDALLREIQAHPGQEIFKKALNWSREVNAAIRLLPEDDIKPFEGAKEALGFAHGRADVAIVSSANPDAVLAEWQKHGLLEHTDIVLAQDAGSKAYCIAGLLKKGYDPQRVLMCGDAPGDLTAAQKNGVYFYPILVKSEKSSWDEFASRGFERLMDGSYGGEYQQEKIREFLQNLGGTDKGVTQ